MSIMSLEDLRTILVECAGEEEPGTVAGDITDTPFDDLGYDSLALMETAARIEQRFGVHLSDGEVADMHTPRDVLDAVNAAALRA